MPCGHGYTNKAGCCGTGAKAQVGANCQSKQAFAQIVVEFDGQSPEPIVKVNEFASALGIADALLVKQFTNLLADECLAFKVKVIYSDCYFARGYPPLLQVSTCGPDEHTFDAEVKDLCSISNGQQAFFRVSLFESTTPSCYPVCAATPEAGQVVFNILATQGNECQ